jgi:hypothetical protein
MSSLQSNIIGQSIYCRALLPVIKNDNTTTLGRGGSDYTAASTLQL